MHSILHRILQYDYEVNISLLVRILQDCVRILLRSGTGESTLLPPVWPGFDSWSRRNMWVEFVVGSRLCSKGFSPGTPVFLPPQKPTFPNSNSTWKQWSKSHSVDSTEIIIIIIIIQTIVTICISQETLHE